MKIALILLFSLSLWAKNPHPIVKIDAWFKLEKERTEGRFFKCGFLATVALDQRPHTKMVEITRFNQTEGALFFAHAKADEACNLSYHPYASLNIYLPHTHRQLSISGMVSQVPREEAKKAWNKLPRFTQLIFASSNQGEPLESQKILEDRKKELEKKYSKNIPCPLEFIGYRLMPDQVTFFESHRRSFPTKEIATLERSDWVYVAMEP